MAALPDDVLLLIISYVEVNDILSLRGTSKRFCVMSKLRWVWYDALRRHVIEKGLPVPAATVADLKALTAGHLEARTVHALRVHSNWNSPHPRTRTSLDFNIAPYRADLLPEEQCTSVQHVSFLPGRNGQFLLTAVHCRLTAWEVPLGESEAYPVAEWVFDRRIEQVIVNDDPQAEVVVAVVCSHPTIPGVVECRSFSFDKFHGQFFCKSELRAHRQVVMPLHLLHDDYLVFGDPMHVCFLSMPTIVKPLGKASLAAMPDNQVLAVKAIHRYLLIVRQKAFEVLFAPTWKGMRTPYVSLVTASACIEMDVPASNATIVFRNASFTESDELPDWPSEAVTVLSRFSDDGFETLHQYDFTPNPKAKAVSVEGKVSEGTMDRIPCVFPSEPSSVRCVAPSCCDLRVGPSGKGFWTENRNIVIRHARTPARCLIGFTVKEKSCAEKSVEALEGCPAELDLCKDPLYSRRCNIHEIMWKKYMITATALEDTVGRIAIGDVTGRVEVLDLA